LKTLGFSNIDWENDTNEIKHYPTTWWSIKCITDGHIWHLIKHCHLSIYTWTTCKLTEIYIDWYHCVAGCPKKRFDLTHSWPCSCASDGQESL
jgi:hypothetical protein